MSIQLILSKEKIKSLSLIDTINVADYLIVLIDKEELNCLLYLQQRQSLSMVGLTLMIQTVNHQQGLIEQHEANLLIHNMTEKVILMATLADQSLLQLNLSEFFISYYEEQIESGRWIGYKAKPSLFNKLSQRIGQKLNEWSAQA